MTLLGLWPYVCSYSSLPVCACLRVRYGWGQHCWLVVAQSNRRLRLVLQQDLRADLAHVLQQDRHLRELARCLQQPPAETQWAAATTLVILLVDDPSTHWVLTQVSSAPAVAACIHSSWPCKACLLSTAAASTAAASRDAVGCGPDARHPARGRPLHALGAHAGELCTCTQGLDPHVFGVARLAIWVQQLQAQQLPAETQWPAASTLVARGQPLHALGAHPGAHRAPHTGI